MSSFGLPRNDVVQIVCGSYEELPAVERNGTIGRVRADGGEDAYIYWNGWHLMGGGPQEGDVPVDMMIFDTSSGEHAVLIGISDEYVVPEGGYDLVVPATYQGLPVTAIGSGVEPDWDDPSYVPPFPGCRSMSSDTATAVADYAFTECTSMAEASFPEAATIPEAAFYECTSLEAASFPEATSIGKDAFRGCTALGSVSFPKAESIGESSFVGCTPLASVSFPAAVSIGKAAFSHLRNLASASFPEATEIGDQAFAGCTAMSSALFPALEHVSHYSFGQCLGITEVELGPITSLATTSFPDWVFYDVDGTTVLQSTAANLRDSTFIGTASKLVKQILS